MRSDLVKPLCNGQTDPETGAFADAAVNVNTALVQVNDAQCQRQTQSKAMYMICFWGSVEGLKYHFFIFVTDAGAIIADTDQQLVV